VASEYLQRIIDHKKKLVKEQEPFYRSLYKQLDLSDYHPYRIFKKCISQAGRLSLIAEIKKASPSKGIIRKDFDLRGIAKIYAEHKADAISVLSEDKYFLGKPAFVKKISDEFHLPVLAKDFFIDEGQIYEARYNGASAVLLIAAILDDALLKKLLKKAGDLDLDCLVEVHNKEELLRALEAGAEIIGINNRDLRTFEVTLKICEALIPQVPQGKIIVAESGIHSHKDVKLMQQLGAHAVVIGEAFMASEDIGKKMDEIMGSTT